MNLFIVFFALLQNCRSTDCIYRCVLTPFLSHSLIVCAFVCAYFLVSFPLFMSFIHKFTFFFPYLFYAVILFINFYIQSNSLSLSFKNTYQRLTCLLGTLFYVFFCPPYILLLTLKPVFISHASLLTYFIQKEAYLWIIQIRYFTTPFILSSGIIIFYCYFASILILLLKKLRVLIYVIIIIWSLLWYVYGFRCINC